MRVLSLIAQQPGFLPSCYKHSQCGNAESTLGMARFKKEKASHAVCLYVDFLLFLKLF